VDCDTQLHRLQLAVPPNAVLLDLGLHSIERGAIVIEVGVTAANETVLRPRLLPTDPKVWGAGELHVCGGGNRSRCLLGLRIRLGLLGHRARGHCDNDGVGRGEPMVPRLPRSSQTGKPTPEAEHRHQNDRNDRNGGVGHALLDRLELELDGAKRATDMLHFEYGFPRHGFHHTGDPHHLGANDRPHRNGEVNSVASDRNAIGIASGRWCGRGPDNDNLVVVFCLENFRDQDPRSSIELENMGVGV